MAQLKEMLQQLKAKGAQVTSYSVKAPVAIVAQGKERFAVVPYTMVMSFPGKKYTQSAVMVGASEDGGKRWTFTDALAKTAEEMREVLPNLPNEVKLPPPQAPVFEDTK